MTRRAAKRSRRRLLLTRTGRPPNGCSHGPIERLDRAIADAQGNARGPIARSIRSPSWSAAARSRPACGRPGGFSGALCDCATRPAARARPVAAAVRRAPVAERRGRTRVAHRGGARRGVARDPGGRRDRLAGGIMRLACRRLGALAEGMGARTGLERPPRQPGSRVRHSGRRARCAGSAFRHGRTMRKSHIIS